MLAVIAEACPDVIPVLAVLAATAELAATRLSVKPTLAVLRATAKLVVAILLVMVVAKFPSSPMAAANSFNVSKASGAPPTKL